MSEQENDLALAKLGDWARFEKIVADQQSMVFSMALYFFGNYTAAEEISREVFLDLHRNLTGVPTAAHLCAWLKSSTMHRCINRSRTRVDQFELDSHDDLHRNVVGLPEEQRAIVILRCSEGLKLNEVASILGLPVSTVQNRLDRALASVREELGTANNQTVPNIEDSITVALSRVDPPAEFSDKTVSHIRDLGGARSSATR